jgi:hypothetical protein
VLVAYLERVRERASEQYHRDLLIYALTRPHVKGSLAPPAVPDVLKE